MTEEQMIQILLSMTTNQGIAQWSNQFDSIDKSDLQELDKLAGRLSYRLAMVSEYLSHRGTDGYGDSGHEEAVKQAEAIKKKVRKALGYAFP